LRLALVLGGLPKPEVQFELHDQAGRFVARADLYYRTARLVLEYDGETHRESITEDDRRQNRLTGIGHRLLRYTSADVYQRPER
jgi:very-short-patch-repair endonuclease